MLCFIENVCGTLVSHDLTGAGLSCVSFVVLFLQDAMSGYSQWLRSHSGITTTVMYVTLRKPLFRG